MLRGLQVAPKKGRLEPVLLLPPAGRLWRWQRESSPGCKWQDQRQHTHAGVWKIPARHKDTLFIYVDSKVVKHWSGARSGCAISCPGDSPNSAGQAPSNLILLDTAIAGGWDWMTSRDAFQPAWFHDLRCFFSGGRVCKESKTSGQTGVAPRTAPPNELPGLVSSLEEKQRHS